MVWFITTRKLRKPAVLMGAACTGVLFGVVVFQRFLYSRPSNHLPRPSHSSPHLLPSFSPSSSPKQCSTCNSSSYKQLKKFESTRIFKESVIKRLDMVFLGSNSPIEDRYVVGTSEGLGAAFLSMIDGHRGTLCSQYLQENILQHISGHFSAHMGQKDDMKVVLDMDSAAKGGDAIVHRDSIGEGGMSAEKIVEGLRSSLVHLDDKISQEGLEAVKLLSSGQPLSNEMETKIETAVHGACALTAMLKRDEVFVANTGDCRVVLGRQRGKQGAGSHWEPLPLSVDQNAQNEEEVNRMLAAHPGEESSVIKNGRVLGSLMPFRTFGDADLKWEKKYLRKIARIVPLEIYKTPPYITAEPVLSQHKFASSDKFLILATDGLWERISNQQAVDIVGGVLSRKQDEDSLGDGVKVSADSASCCAVNAATELLWHSLGGTDGNVSEMLTLDPSISRYYRDDITIMVVYL